MFTHKVAVVAIVGAVLALLWGMAGLFFATPDQWTLIDSIFKAFGVDVSKWSVATRVFTMVVIALTFISAISIWQWVVYAKENREIRKPKVAIEQFFVNLEFEIAGLTIVNQSFTDTIKCVAILSNIVQPNGTSGCAFPQSPLGYGERINEQDYLVTDTTTIANVAGEITILPRQPAHVLIARAETYGLSIQHIQPRYRTEHFYTDHGVYRFTVTIYGSGDPVVEEHPFQYTKRGIEPHND